MDIRENISLSNFTTLKVGGPARYFCQAATLADIEQGVNFARSASLPLLVIGGGSNLLVSDNGFPGLVMQVANKGLSVIREDKQSALLAVNSGELWDDVVSYAAGHGLWGIENLSHIPGLAGGFAVQNVGAYGQEASQVVREVSVFDRQDSAVKTLRAEECGFSYRRSIFNTVQKGRYVILSTKLLLSKKPSPNLAYKDLTRWFEGQPQPDLAAIRQAIIAIRAKKFPYPYDPGAKGSAGSFFKNIILNEQQFDETMATIQTKMGDSISPAMLERLAEFRDKYFSGGSIKLPTAFILEMCEVKGVAVGGARINQTQPLVILNDTGAATADDVLSLVKKVRETVIRQTGLHLYTEPELIGFTERELREALFNDEEIARYQTNY